MKKTWRTPEIKSIAFDDMAKMISARANSWNPPGRPCSDWSGECSCQGACDPLALYWSCYSFWLGVG